MYDFTISTGWVSLLCAAAPALRGQHAVYI